MAVLNNSMTKIRPVVIAGWFWIAFSIVVLFVFAGIRVFEMIQPPLLNVEFARRYAEHPFVSLLHMIPGLLFLGLAPLQFIAKIRREHPAWHRLNGRILVVLATVSGLYAFIAALVFPAFGGTSTLLATLLFGTWFFIALWQAVSNIRRRQIAAHREWMIRVFAIALGVATIRAVIGIGQGLLGYSLEEIFPISFWTGFSINTVAAELWIHYSRKKPLAPKPNFAAEQEKS